MGIDLAGTVLEILSGQTPAIASLSDDRLKRLLRPLLSAIDADLDNHRLTHDWPPNLQMARSTVRDHDKRLDSYLKVLRASPSRPAFRAIYEDWITTHSELSKICLAPNEIPTKQMTVLDGGRARVPQTLFCTVWATEFNCDGDPATSGTLGILGLLDEILAKRVDESGVDIERRIRGREKKAEQQGKARGERGANKELAKAEKVLAQARAELSEVQTKYARLHTQHQAANKTIATIRAELGQYRREVGQIGTERNALLERLQGIRELLKEEREGSHFLEARIANLSEDLRVLGVHLAQLENELSMAPQGARGIFDLLNKEVDDEALKRDTSQGKSQISADQKHKALVKLRREFLAVYPEHEPIEEPHPGRTERRAGFRVIALGGGTDIGASCYLLELGGFRLLIDCGIKVQETNISHLGPDLPELDDVHAVIVTHAHIDHVGWLPTLIARGYAGHIYCTRETSDLLEIMLQDSRKQLERLMAIENLHARYSGEAVTPEPYCVDDVQNVLLRLRPEAYDAPVPLSAAVSFRFARAGHILGAASVEIEGGGRRIFFTGDFSTFPQQTVQAIRWPVETPGFDLVVTESTYGHRDREPREEAVNSLVVALRETLERGGTAIIPSFALGRAQEVLSILARAMERGDLESVPVWIDGMTESIDLVYQAHHRLELPENFHHVRSEGFRREDVVARTKATPSIIVSTSGMLAGGPVVLYASRLLQDGRNRLFFCGYQDEEQPGAKLLRLSHASKGERRVEVSDENGEKVEIYAASPAQKFSLSAHSDASEMVGALETLKPRHIMLVHGDDEARRGFLKRLLAAGLSASLDTQHQVEPT